MLSLSSLPSVPALICFAFLLLFFSFLPNLKTCRLPRRRSDASETADSRRRETLSVLTVTLLYAAVAFWNLGDISSPETFIPMQNRSVVLQPLSDKTPAKIMLFCGTGQGEYSVECSWDGEYWTPAASLEQDHVAVLKWHTLELELSSAPSYFRVNCLWGTPWLGELVFLDSEGLPVPYNCSDEALRDEQVLVPEKMTYRNSSYFDEIYHARTAWEHLHAIWPYEISHPPLGKNLISLGILLFGMTPFGWRFSGTVAGVLMIPVMYLLLKRLFGGRRIPMIGSILLFSGFLHYTQTRIATIDSFSVLFILLMYYFMAGWLQDDNPGSLGLCGLCFGAGAACKWICLYAGAGLAVLWCSHWIWRFSSANQSERKALVPALIRNILFCLLYFIVLPCLIYYLSYLPYGKAKGFPAFSRPYTRMVLENQSFMYSYHANVLAEHPYSSRWYQWILDIRPILYYVEYLPEGKRISVAAFVNPLICWGGLITLPILLWTAIGRRDRTAVFLIIAYLAELIPWMFIRRITFAYHYFAAAVFLIPCLCYVFRLMERSSRLARIMTIVFTVLSVFLFVLFFPVLNGLPVAHETAKALFTWLKTWPI